MRYILKNYYLIFLAALPSSCPFRLWQLVVHIYHHVYNNNFPNEVLDEESLNHFIEILEKVVRENA